MVAVQNEKSFKKNGFQIAHSQYKRNIGINPILLISRNISQSLGQEFHNKLSNKEKVT